MNQSIAGPAPLLLGLRIIIADDSELRLKPLSDLLAASGASVETVGPGTALAAIERERPGFLIRKAGLSDSRALIDAAARMNIEHVAISCRDSDIDPALCRVIAKLALRA